MLSSVFGCGPVRHICARFHLFSFLSHFLPPPTVLFAAAGNQRVGNFKGRLGKCSQTQSASCNIVLGNIEK